VGRVSVLPASHGTSSAHTTVSDHPDLASHEWRRSRLSSAWSEMKKWWARARAVYICLQEWESHHQVAAILCISHCVLYDITVLYGREGPSDRPGPGYAIWGFVHILQGTIPFPLNLLNKKDILTAPFKQTSSQSTEGHVFIPQQYCYMWKVCVLILWDTRIGGGTKVEFCGSRPSHTHAHTHTKWFYNKRGLCMATDRIKYWLHKSN
jgi:hypothetical protein